jgi:hypothetical protein
MKMLPPYRPYGKGLLIQRRELRPGILFSVQQGGRGHFYHFPQESAARIRLDTVTDWLMQYSQTLDLVVYNVFTDIDLHIYRENLS